MGFGVSNSLKSSVQVDLSKFSSFSTISWSEDNSAIGNGAFWSKCWGLKLCFIISLAVAIYLWSISITDLSELLSPALGIWTKVADSSRTNSSTTLLISSTTWFLTSFDLFISCSITILRACSMISTTKTTDIAFWTGFDVIFVAADIFREQFKTVLSRIDYSQAALFLFSGFIWYFWFLPKHFSL